MEDVRAWLVLTNVLLLAVLTVFVTEVSLYLANHAGYWAFGPAVLRERWRTAAPAETAFAAVVEAAEGCGLVAAVHGAHVCLRKPAQAISFWPRVRLTVAPGENGKGAVLRYEVRPFLSVALLTLPMLSLMPVRAAGGADNLLWPLCGLAGVVGGYVGFGIWELPGLAMMEPLRERLGRAGLQIRPD